MRTIKFRGRDIETGRTVYGGYKVGRCGEPIIITNFTAAYEVTPDSVAQLIGIDAHGREVYEGDTVIRIAGDEDFNPEKTFPMAAAFDDYAAIRDEEIVLVEAVTNEAD